MRVVVHFSGRLLEGRGTPSRARNLAVALAARPGVEVAVVSGDAAGAALPEGIAHRGAGSPGAAAAALARAVRELAPDVVWGHTHKALAPLAALRGGPPRVVDLHGDLAAERLEQTWRPWSRRLAGWARARLDERRHQRAMDAFTVVTDGLARRVAGLGKPVLVLRGGVDPDLFRPLARPPAAVLTVVYAGNFRPYQGVSTLLDAAEILVRRGEGLRLVFVGGSDRFPEVERRARELLGERLAVRGRVAYERMPEALAEADVLVIPRPRSRTAAFGFPSKLAEYLATGRPVVATRVGDVERFVVHGENGLLVPPGAPSALADALLSLRDPELRRRLGAAGRATAEAELSWRRIAADLEAFLRRVAGDDA